MFFPQINLSILQIYLNRVRSEAFFFFFFDMKAVAG